MKRKNEKVPGFDEIIFENRNKEYGAYDLRKKNLPATFLSMVGGVALFSGIVLSGSIGNEKRPIVMPKGPKVVVLTVDKSLADVNKLKPDVPPQPKFIKPTPYMAPDIVDKIDSNDKQLAAVSELDTMKNRPVDTDVTLVNDPISNIVPVDPDPVSIVQEMPEFPGGTDGIMKFISENVKYPPKAVENGLEGRVILRFVVSTDGSVKRIEILRSVDPVLDQEAVRVISQMPKWKPGKNNGTPAAVWFSVPVTFRLKKT